MTYGIRTAYTPPALIHVSEVEAAIYTAPQHNRKRGWPKDVPTHWYCYVWGCSGYGDNPIRALASACERWVRWNEPEYVQNAIAEYRAKQQERAGNEIVDEAPEESRSGVCSEVRVLSSPPSERSHRPRRVAGLVQDLHRGDGQLAESEEAPSREDQEEVTLFTQESGQ